jgi:hypothetical protein
MGVHIVLDPPFFDAVAGVPIASEEALVERHSSRNRPF